MANIRCQIPNNNENMVDFVVYRDAMITSIIKIGQKLMEYPSIEQSIDLEKLNSSIAGLKTRRKEILLRKSRLKLGKGEGEFDPKGLQEKIDDWHYSNHPMGEIIDAALKAAQGHSTLKIKTAIDDRVWYRLRSIVIELPEEAIYVDESEMRSAVDKLLSDSKKRRVVAAFINGENNAVELFSNEMRKVIQAVSVKPVGFIKPCKIEIFPNRISDKSPPSKNAYKDEEEAIESLVAAVRARVETRLQALSWSGEIANKIKVYADTSR